MPEREARSCGDDGHVLTDQQIDSLSPADRRDLITRLVRPVHEVVTESPGRLILRRRIRIGVVAGCAILLVPWIVYLALSLPGEHRVRNWDVMWVGFDAIELLLLALTLWLGLRRRFLVVLAAFATGVVLLCDAWFDLMTAGPGDLWQSVLAAVVLEIPLSLLLMSTAIRVVRTVPALLWFTEPGTSVWDVRLPRLQEGRGQPAATIDES